MPSSSKGRELGEIHRGEVVGGLARTKDLALAYMCVAAILVHGYHANLQEVRPQHGLIAGLIVDRKKWNAHPPHRLSELHDLYMVEG